MARTVDDIAQVLERFVRREFRVSDQDATFNRDTDLYDSGFVDSAGVVELIAFVESAFGVESQDEDLFSDQFTTINGISGAVHRRLAGALPDTIPR